MAQSWLDEIADRLIADGVVDAAGIFVGWAPPDPDTAVWLLAYRGPGPTRTLSGTQATRPRFQLVSRHATYVGAENQAAKAAAVLDAIVDEDLPGQDLDGNPVQVRYHVIEALGDPFDLGVDDSGRHRVVVSFQAWRKLVPW